MNKKGFKFAVISVCLCFGYSAGLYAETKQTPPIHDIRILIDVSGSMKWNDPDNLRTPALRLLANLLPTGARAGVWTFGRHVNMLVPLDTVDSQWKQRATEAAGEIRSNGLFTNIEDTLSKSTWDWKREDKNFSRTIILLTDGLVDIDSDASKNRASRDSIINHIIPRLAGAGATIHTIALSGEADELLLKQLAAASNGWYEKIKNADSLEPIFFRMFEKTTQPDTLPLVDNRVVVDSSIREMTLLIFNRSDTQPATITPPNGDLFGRKHSPKNVNWHHDARYDLVTITDPASGTWKIEADTDPDNRVMVVTDLKMVNTSLPNNLYLGDDLAYFVSLTNDGKIIRKPAFHRFIDVTLQQTTHGKETLHDLHDDGNSPDAKAGDGTYSLNLSHALTEGRHEFLARVDGVTFHREKRHFVNVYSSPVIATIKPEKMLDAAIETLFIIPHADMINLDSIRINATIFDRNGEIQRLEIQRSSHNEWKLPLGDFSSDKQYSITLAIEGVRPNGKPVESSIGPISFGDPTEQTGKSAPPKTAEPVDAIKPTEPTETQPEKEPADDTPVNWIAAAIPVVMFNLLLIGGLFFGYRKWKNRPKPNQKTPWESLAHE